MLTGRRSTWLSRNDAVEEHLAPAKRAPYGVGAFAKMRCGVLVLANEPTSMPRSFRLPRHDSGCPILAKTAPEAFVIRFSSFVISSSHPLRLNIEEELEVFLLQEVREAAFAEDVADHEVLLLLKGHDLLLNGAAG